MTTTRIQKSPSLSLDLNPATQTECRRSTACSNTKALENVLPAVELDLGSYSDLLLLNWLLVRAQNGNVDLHKKVDQL